MVSGPRSIIFRVTDPQARGHGAHGVRIARTGRPARGRGYPQGRPNWRVFFQGQGLAADARPYRRRMHELSQAALEPPAAERFFRMLGESAGRFIYGPAAA